MTNHHSEFGTGILTFIYVYPHLHDTISAPLRACSVTTFTSPAIEAISRCSQLFHAVNNARFDAHFNISI